VAISSSAPSTLPDAGPAPYCALARDRAELAAHHAIRRAVFVDQQRLFEHDDRDARDGDPATLHAVGYAGDEITGAVRLYPLDDDGLWKGDRLAVLPSTRSLQLGAMLVRFAVRTAGERGGRLMVAQVQVPNVRFFERLGWSRDGDPAPMLGVEHQAMTIGLGRPARAGLNHPGR
jgi:putative N-acetyltransferase (TIGR04045 family)